MTIQFNTDKNIQGTQELEAYVSDSIQEELKHFVQHLTRIEVHLSDQNAQKGGADDILCKIEARLKGMQPVIVEGKDSEKEKALDKALDKMKATLTRIIGKMRDS
jgi:ribosomal subunit interface protein